jgi:hypothetical protein
MTFYEQAIRDMCDDIIERAQRNIGATRTIRGKRRRRVSTGNLKNSLRYTLKRKTDGANVKFDAKGSASNYWDVIERGRRPNRKPPPIDAIVEWMKKKPVKLQAKGGGFIKSTPQAQRAAAYLIARAIGKRGIEGIKFYEEAINAAIEDWGVRLEEAMKKDIEQRLNEIE